MGPSSEPAHDSDTFHCQLGTREVAGSVWKKLGLEECVWNIGANMMHSGGKAPITQSWHTSQRLEPCKVCWSLQSTPCGTDKGNQGPGRKGPAQGPPTGWWQSQLGEQGHLDFSPRFQLCSISASYTTFLEMGDKELGVCEDSNISITQGLATGST